jgi:Holliday junction resolvasome RuvABC endonuclease subunit
VGIKMILGLDASISSTGWAVVDSDNNLIDFGKLVTKKDKKIDENLDNDRRIFYIASSIGELFRKYNITDISMESQFLGKNAKTALQLSRLRGALMMVCKLNGIDLDYDSPNEIRLNLMGKGNASKEEVCDYIRFIAYPDDERVQAMGELNDKSGHKDKNSDMYDAIATALAYNKKVKKV